MKNPHMTEIFMGVRSYEEVQDRFQTPPSDQQVGFINFQKHRQNSLPKVLQGESITTPPSHEAMPTASESSHFGKHKVEGTLKSSEVLTQELEASLSGQISPQALAQLKAFLKQSQEVPPSTPNTPAGTSNTIEHNSPQRLILLLHR
jgi:hypothetical protein